MKAEAEAAAAAKAAEEAAEAKAKVDQDAARAESEREARRQLEETKAAAAAAESEAEARIKADAAAQAARRTPRPSGEMVAADEVTPEVTEEASPYPVANQPRGDWKPPADGSPDPTVPAVVSFGGLFFLDGKDSKGRPVAVINASKLPEESDMRSTALQHILACLEPHADETGEKLGFSLVVYYTGPAPPGILRWLASVYHSLSYGVRKGVKTIALVNPSWFMSTVVTTLMPLVSAKAYKKVVMCKGLHNLGNAAGIPEKALGIPFLHSIGKV